MWSHCSPVLLASTTDPLKVKYALKCRGYSCARQAKDSLAQLLTYLVHLIPLGLRPLLFQLSNHPPQPGSVVPDLDMPLTSSH